MSDAPIPVYDPPSEEHRAVIKKLGEHVSSLQVSLPTNKEDLPLSYIDPQVLLESGFLNDELNIDIIDKAVVPIEYAEGYPVVDGLPFWDRLGGELLEYYNLFKHYRDQKLKSAVRSYREVGDQVHLPLDYIVGLSKAFHWRARVKAFDLYMIMEREARRTREMVLLEGKHLKAAEDIFDVCMKFIRKDDAEKQLSAKSALEWFEAAIKLGRLSLGLPPDKPVGVTDQASISIHTAINQVTARSASRLPTGRRETITWLQEVLDVLIETGQLHRVIETQAKEVDGKDSSSGDEPRASLPVADSTHSEDDKIHTP